MFELAFEPGLEAEVGLRGVVAVLGRKSVGVGGVTKVLGVPKGGGVSGMSVLIGFGVEDPFVTVELCSVGSRGTEMSSTVDPRLEATPPLLPPPASTPVSPPALAPPADLTESVSSVGFGVIEFLLDGVKASLSFPTGEELRFGDEDTSSEFVFLRARASPRGCTASTEGSVVVEGSTVSAVIRGEDRVR